MTAGEATYVPPVKGGLDLSIGGSGISLDALGSNPIGGGSSEISGQLSALTNMVREMNDRLLRIEGSDLDFAASSDTYLVRFRVDVVNSDGSIERKERSLSLGVVRFMQDLTTTQVLQVLDGKIIVDSDKCLFRGGGRHHLHLLREQHPLVLKKNSEIVCLGDSITDDSSGLIYLELIDEQGEFQFGLDSMWRAGTGFLCLVLPRTFIDPGFRALSTPSVSFESVVVPSGLPENVPNDPSKTGPIKKDDTVVGLDDTRADKKKPQ